MCQTIQPNIHAFHNMELVFYYTISFYKDLHWQTSTLPITPVVHVLVSKCNQQTTSTSLLEPHKAKINVLWAEQKNSLVHVCQYFTQHSLDTKFHHSPRLFLPLPLNVRINTGCQQLPCDRDPSTPECYRLDKLPTSILLLLVLLSSSALGSV